MKIRLFTIPNLITLAALACGCSAIVAALVESNITVAFLLIIAAAILDFFDGFAARMLGSFSEVGKQLDSLSDMVSFGVAPSAILYSVFTASGGHPLWGLIVFVMALFSALRLAKFNIDENQTSDFIGLPTPAGALLAGSLGLLHATGSLLLPPAAIVSTAVATGIMLIVPVRMFSLKFKNFSLRDNAVRYSFIALSAIILALLQLQAVPVIIILYIITSVVLSFICTGSGAGSTNV